MDESQEKQVVRDLFDILSKVIRRTRSLTFGLNIWVIWLLLTTAKILPLAIGLSVGIALFTILDIVLLTKLYNIAKLRAEQFTNRV